MTTNHLTFIENVPIRIRVAFALAIADKVLPALKSNTDALNTARSAITDAWRWVAGEDVRAMRLYENHVEGLAVQSSIVSNDHESAAFCAVTSAFYYAMWHAFEQDLASNRVSEGDVYNDIAEVGEDTIQEVVELACQTTLCDTEWMRSTSLRLVNEFRRMNSNDLGPTVSRDDFRE